VPVDVAQASICDAAVSDTRPFLQQSQSPQPALVGEAITSTGRSKQDDACSPRIAWGENPFNVQSCCSAQRRLSFLENRQQRAVQRRFQEGIGPTSRPAQRLSSGAGDSETDAGSEHEPPARST